MNNNKLGAILALVETCENNIKSVKLMLQQMGVPGASFSTADFAIPKTTSSSPTFSIDHTSDSFVEGYFDGESMIGDNGQIYPVPQNYASKTQLVVGDRMKWSLGTNNYGEKHEMFKLIVPVARQKVIGKFMTDGVNFTVILDTQTTPVKVLKASATYAMKNLGLKMGGLIAVYVPKNGPITHGAFVSVVGENTTAASGLYDEFIDSTETKSAPEPIKNKSSNDILSSDFDLEKSFF